MDRDLVKQGEADHCGATVKISFSFGGIFWPISIGESKRAICHRFSELELIQLPNVQNASTPQTRRLYIFESANLTVATLVSCTNTSLYAIYPISLEHPFYHHALVNLSFSVQQQGDAGSTLSIYSHSPIRSISEGSPLASGNARK